MCTLLGGEISRFLLVMSFGTTLLRIISAAPRCQLWDHTSARIIPAAPPVRQRQLLHRWLVVH
jgi:hypothetical protein